MNLRKRLKIMNEDDKNCLFEMFRGDLFERMKRYAPPNSFDLDHRAKVISGRLLEETVEFHLASGGTPTTAMSHVMDAVANETLKEYKSKGQSGGSNQQCYPSRLSKDYSRVNVVEESADAMFLLIVANYVSAVNIEELFEGIINKVEKLEKAATDGKLTKTDNGLFYIKKN